MPVPTGTDPHGSPNPCAPHNRGGHEHGQNFELDQTRLAKPDPLGIHTRPDPPGHTGPARYTHNPGS